MKKKKKRKKGGKSNYKILERTIGFTIGSRGNGERTDRRARTLSPKEERGQMEVGIPAQREPARSSPWHPLLSRFSSFIRANF